MHQLVDERREDILGREVPEIYGIHGDLVGHGPVRPAPVLRAEVAQDCWPVRVREQDAWKGAAEKRRVEVVERGPEPAQRLARWIDGGGCRSHICIVRYKSFASSLARTVRPRDSLRVFARVKPRLPASLGGTALPTWMY